nr:ribosome small subunit-dependent GTPase A [Rhodococcus sp. (in: high G+C Gram-positive bacteria)]
MSLGTYGYDSYWQNIFRSTHPLRDPARVIGVDRGTSDVVTEHGPTRVRTGRLGVCTGDWLALADGDVAALLPRRTAVVRASAGTTSDTQVLAANVDTAVVTVAADTTLDLGRIERYLALAWDSGATPLVVVTKCDRAFDIPGRVAAVRGAAPGVDVMSVSAQDGAGLISLAEHLVGTVVLLGPSGSGKSTLGNALTGSTSLLTGDVRLADAKGKHTTVRRELIPLPTHGTTLIDTPGLRSVGIVSSESGLQQAFSDIEELSTGCRFNDCNHAEEPGCAVREGVDPGRIARYRKLQRENAWSTSRHDVQANRTRLREAKQLAKLQRRMYKQ